MSEQSKIAVLEPQAPQVVPRAAITPTEMLALAVEKGAAVETLERLLALQERYEANEARKAYVAAVAAFKAEAPTLVKNKHVRFPTRTGPDTEYWHTTLDYAVEVLAPLLSKYGLTHQWETNQADQLIEVSCTLRHVLGHSEKVTLRAGAEASGTKNNIQAIGSTVTYLQRYTFLAITGMATKGQDDDGKASIVGFVTADQADELQMLAESVGADKPKFFAYIGAESFATIPAKKFAAAKAALLKKADKK